MVKILQEYSTDDLNYVSDMNDITGGDRIDLKFEKFDIIKKLYLRYYD